jgi:DNA invertase Pin-like site-specific DNA recombinase
VKTILHLCTIADTLQRKNVALQVIDQNIDTSSTTGRLLFNMLAAIAEFETELRSERQLDGINKAKELGVRFGRSKRLSPQQVVELQLQRQQGVLIKILMKDFDLSKASVYRYLGKSSSEVP